jgi:hypothetical protein
MDLSDGSGTRLKFIFLRGAMRRVMPAWDMDDLALVYENHLRKVDINAELVDRLATSKSWLL